MKPKTNRGGDIYVPMGYDACQTPPEAVKLITPQLYKRWNIWEPAKGEEGLLMQGLIAEGFYNVEGSDILTGQNFFDWEPGQWDVIVTNPPYSIKYEWMQRCYELGKPWALLLPVETLGAQAAQELFHVYGAPGVIFPYGRINFKMPNQGWNGSGAQFPVAWFCHKLTMPSTMYFSKEIPPDKVKRYNRKIKKYRRE